MENVLQEFIVISTSKSMIVIKSIRKWNNCWGRGYLLYRIILSFTSTAGSGAIGIIISWINRTFIRNNLISGFEQNIYFDRIMDTSFVVNNISINSFYPFGSIYLRNIKMVVENNIFTKNQVGLRV